MFDKYLVTGATGFLGRAVADELETITPEKEWPFPTYGDLLFRV